MAMKGNGLNPITEELIAPCGMNCAICSRYLAHLNGVKRSQCMGCRSRDRECTYLFGKCAGINHSLKRNAHFCYECAQYPCKQIKRMDKRYRANYLMSNLENLEQIKTIGIERFISAQYGKYRCSKCGGVISIHNEKCFKCDPIRRLVEKRRRE